jgi:hypothetical protein
MSKKRDTKVASDGGPEFTSAGVPWSEVPEFARADVAWIDGRHGLAESSLPPVDVVPVPDERGEGFWQQSARRVIWAR